MTAPAHIKAAHKLTSDELVELKHGRSHWTVEDYQREAPAAVIAVNPRLAEAPSWELKHNAAAWVEMTCPREKLQAWRDAQRAARFAEFGAPTEAPQYPMVMGGQA